MVCHQGSRVHVCHLGLLKCKDIVITNAVTLLFAKENDTISLYRQVCRRGWVGRTVVETCDTLSSEVCHRQYKVARLESCAPHPPTSSSSSSSSHYLKFIILLWLRLPSSLNDILHCRRRKHFIWLLWEEWELRAVAACKGQWKQGRDLSWSPPLLSSCQTNQSLDNSLSSLLSHFCSSQFQQSKPR